MNRAAELGPQAFAWWPDWRGQCAAVVGAGPSLKGVCLEPLRGKVRVIAVCESFRLVPWADALYSCDFAWWQMHKGLKDWPTLRFAHDARACQEYGIHRTQVADVSCDDITTDEPGRIGAGGNSGFQAFNLAIQFGVRAVLLIGIDCHLEFGLHNPHWHGRHPSPLSNPLESNVARWRKAFDSVAGKVRGLGVEVINCSTSSALANYPKMTIDAALARLAS